MNSNIPEFLEVMLEEQYGKEITKKIIQGYQSRRYTTLRVNTLKTTIDDVEKTLQKEIIDYEKVSWSNEAFIIKNATEKELKKLDIYNNGDIYLQSLSSMLPPIILQPMPKLDILDMSAAPGSKTTQIAAITQNKANITACEINKIRAERLKYNLEKQGANAYVMIQDATKIDDFFSFDQILLDAPCSGSGTINLQFNNKKDLCTKKLVENSTVLQANLIKKAIKLLKSGKEMVYSTCSILSCENEDIISNILKEGKADIVPIKIKGIEQVPLLPSKIEGTLCVCPNEYYEGFFVAKIRKR